MEDKEKQIEEIAKDLGIAFQLAGTTRFGAVAEILVDKWQRKTPKDGVVLPKEEYDCLKKIEKSYDPFWFCSFGGCEGVSKECKDTCEMSIFVKERKETAEKYNDKLVAIIQHLFDTGQIDFKAKIEFLKENEKILKQLGVETKE